MIRRVAPGLVYFGIPFLLNLFLFYLFELRNKIEHSTNYNRLHNYIVICQKKNNSHTLVITINSGVRQHY